MDLLKRMLGGREDPLAEIRRKTRPRAIQRLGPGKFRVGERQCGHGQDSRADDARAAASAVRHRA